MTDKKFTDREIIKALEYCNADRNECDKCVLKRKCESNPFYSVVAEYALEIINRQKAEIKRLNGKLIHALSELSLTRTSLIDAKIEAYKEFAERIRECCAVNDDLTADAYLSVTTDINCALKEMIGEKE